MVMTAGPTCLVVGGGLSACAFAGALAEDGPASVEMVTNARGLGGRAATRWIRKGSGETWSHGAPWVEATPELQAVLEPILARKQGPAGELVGRSTVKIRDECVGEGNER